MAVVTGTAAQALNSAGGKLEMIAKLVSGISDGLEKGIKKLEGAINTRKELEDLEFRHATFALRQAKELQDFNFSYLSKQIEYAEALFKKNTMAIEKTKQLLNLESEVYNVRKKAAESVVNYYKGLNTLIEPLSKISNIASQLSREIGISREAMMSLRNDTMNLVNSGNFQQKYNTTVEEMLKVTSSLTKAIGRQVSQSDGNNENLAALRSVFGDEKAVELVSKMSVFGKDTERAAGVAAKMFANANKYGISLERYSKNFITNMKLAQTLTFERGLEGLRRMAEAASEINLNMQETAKVADKYSTLEGAMSASAQLSVLGGNFTSFSNPLAMMNEAFNDAESLQDRLVNMFGSLARWDSNRGEITMSGYNRQRLKVASNALGVDSNEMFNMVFEKARRDRLLPEVNSLGFNNEISKLLLNVAQLDANGRGYVTHNGEQYSLSEVGQMTQGELQELLIRNSSDSDNIKTIAQSLISIDESVRGYSSLFNDIFAENLASMEGEVRNSAINAGKNQASMNKSVEQLMEVGFKSLELEQKRALFEDDSLTRTLAFRKRQIEFQQFQTEMAYLQSKYNYEIDMPIKQQELILRQAQDKRSDAMFRLQRMGIQMQLYGTIAQVAKSFGAIPGMIGGAMAVLGGLIPLIPAVLNTVNDVEGVGKGIKTGIGSAWANLTSFDEILPKTLTNMNVFNKHWDVVRAKMDDHYMFDSSTPNNGANSYMNNVELNNVVKSRTNTLDVSQTAINGVPTGNYNYGAKNPGSVRSGASSYGGHMADGGIVRARSHADGGINVNMEGGEYIIPKSQVPYYATTLDRIRNGSYKKDGSDGSVNLNVGGTIRLELNGSSANIDARDLLSDPIFIRKLAYEITKSSEDRNNFGVNANSRIFGV